MTYVILGFGACEELERARIREAIARDGAEAAEREWSVRADEYGKLPREAAPERYTRFWCYDGKIHYHHINRRHPFSPDGWAMWRYVEPHL